MAKKIVRSKSLKLEGKLVSEWLDNQNNSNASINGALKFVAKSLGTGDFQDAQTDEIIRLRKIIEDAMIAQSKSLGKVKANNSSANATKLVKDITSKENANGTDINMGVLSNTTKKQQGNQHINLICN